MEADTAKKKFLPFENNSNLCWLDASVSLIAHNKTLERIAKICPDSRLNQIIGTYSEAMHILNDSSSKNSPVDREQKCKQKLQNIQTSTLQYLQPILKNKTGEPDSAFCALLNLFYENKFIKETLNLVWSWKKLCSHCGISNVSNPTPKPIVTLSKVKKFNPCFPTSIYTCSCKTEQEMRLIYKQVPPCIVFHFEQGAGKGKIPMLFILRDRKYKLTCVISLEKAKSSSVNHFVTWIRDPFKQEWLECNDLSKEATIFSSIGPVFKLEDVYMFVYESFDNLNKITIETATTDSHFLGHDSGSFVEFIDISDESKSLNTALENTSSCTENLNNIEKSFSDLCLKDSVNHTDLFSSKDKIMSIDFSKPTLPNSKNVKVAGEKNHSGVSRDVCIENKEIKRVFTIENLKFIKKNGKTTEAFLRQQSPSDSRSSSIKNRSHYQDCFLDFLLLGNISERADKEAFLSDSIDISIQKAFSKMSFRNENEIEKKSEIDSFSNNNIRQKASSEMSFVNENLIEKKTGKNYSSLNNYSSSDDTSKQKCKLTSADLFLCSDTVECQPIKIQTLKKEKKVFDYDVPNLCMQSAMLKRDDNQWDGCTNKSAGGGCKIANANSISETHKASKSLQEKSRENHTIPKCNKKIEEINPKVCKTATSDESVISSPKRNALKSYENTTYKSPTKNSCFRNKRTKEEVIKSHASGSHKSRSKSGSTKNPTKNTKPQKKKVNDRFIMISEERKKLDELFEEIMDQFASLTSEERKKCVELFEEIMDRIFASLTPSEERKKLDELFEEIMDRTSASLLLHVYTKHFSLKKKKCKGQI